MAVFSRPYLFCEEEAPHSVGLNKFMGNSQVFGGINPTQWGAPISGGIFFEIWPFKKVMVFI
jgi:hypothetical protein